MITCSEGTIFWDPSLTQVKWINRQKESFLFSYKGFERNDRFKEIMQVFLEEKNDKRLTTLESALPSLEMVLAAKTSSEHEIFIHLNGLQCSF